MAKIKICGLKNLNDISFVNEVQIDYAGFIFAPKSKRYVNIELAKQLKKSLNPKIKSVGVFVDENIDIITNIAQEKIIDLIQLHADESNNYIEELKKRTNLLVIKAFKADFNLKENIQNTVADYVLIDSFNENAFGGTGRTFDYGLIPNTNKPIFLAGGLNIQNIDIAIKTKPYCLDINSGVETDGKKDKNKIFELVNKIRQLQ